MHHNVQPPLGLCNTVEESGRTSCSKYGVGKAMMGGWNNGECWEMQGGQVKGIVTVSEEFMNNCTS